MKSDPNAAPAPNRKPLIAILAVLSLGGILVFAAYKIGLNTSNGQQPRLEPNSHVEEQDQTGQFGSDRVKDGQDAKPVAFDGKRAMKYLESICDLGPRISGSQKMRDQQALIKKHFEGLGAKVEFQTFDATQNSVRGKTPMTNIIVSFHPDKKRRVILCCHYDTRPIADQEADERDWKKPFLSANDGGSGVALLMELGSHMKGLKTHVGVDFVFFDGEEYIYRNEKTEPRSDKSTHDRYFIGSQHFALTWRQAKKSDRPDYAAAILLDMIAGANLNIPYEIHSWNRYPDLCKSVWSIARELNCTAFVPRTKYEVLDDHLSLQTVGIPAIDLIDFDYAHWHKLSDTPANCAGANMEQVAKVLSVWLQRAK
jgi:hypothetical protein